jgi:hypothetical protein
MSDLKWQRVQPDDVAWQTMDDAPTETPAETPALIRDLKSNGPCIAQVKLPGDYASAAHWYPFDTIYIVTKGEMTVGDEGMYRSGDLRWAKAGHQCGPLRAGTEGVEYFLVSPGNNVSITPPQEDDAPEALVARLAVSKPGWGRVNLDDVPWEQFADPAGRPTQPVQLLFNDDPYVLRTRFVPGYVAGEHWHDFDTLYFITNGRMRFGEEGWYETGDIRWVTGGHSYGPEQPGDQGVEFLLVSCGGPVNLRWTDLEPAPHGSLLPPA